MTRKPTNILLIEDDYATRLSLKLILEHRDVIVGEAETAKEGIELAVELKPGVIIVDFALPGMNGLEATSLKHSNWDW